MSSVNVFAFTGRLGAPAELKYTQGGTPIWFARVAVDYGWGDNKGTSWINAKALGKHAEALGKLDLPKGAAIGGTGELQVRDALAGVWSYRREVERRAAFKAVTGRRAR